MPKPKRNEALERKVFPFVLDEKADERTIAGYANVYNVMDEVGDIVEAGTFTRSLQHDDVRPLLWQHNSDELIGDGTFEDTPDGLVLHDGKLFDGVQRADEAYQIAKQTRTKLGLSIGFSITADGSYTDDDGVRHITDAKLYEVSLVTFPANTLSRVESVKSGGFEDDELDLAFSEIVDAGKTLTAEVIVGRKLSDEAMLLLTQAIDALMAVRAAVVADEVVEDEPEGDLPLNEPTPGMVTTIPPESSLLSLDPREVERALQDAHLTLATL